MVRQEKNKLCLLKFRKIPDVNMNFEKRRNGT